MPNIRSTGPRWKPSGVNIVPEIARFENVKLQAQPGKEWQKFNIGAVIVREVSDHRYGEDLHHSKYNLCGLTILDAALEMLVESKRAPSWLLFPARLFIAPMTEENAESVAEEKSQSLISSMPSVAEKIFKLSSMGMLGVFLGVDNMSYLYQVPVMLQADQSEAIVVTPLARRTYKKKRKTVPPSEYHGTRYHPGPPSVQVVCCKEISGAKKGGDIYGYPLGSNVSLHYVLDMTHYYRERGAYSVSFNRLVCKSMFFASSMKRCNTPVIGSSVFVNRDLITDVNSEPDIRWVAAKRRKNPDRYLRPDDIVWATTSQSNDDPCLAINLFGRK